MKSKSYKMQHGCVDCQHCFVLEEYDEGPHYYCTLNAPPRPKCGSVYMDNERFGFSYTDKKAFRAAWDEWDKWSENRKVVSFGVCDEWMAMPSS